MDELDRTNFQETTTALIESINNAIQTGTSINPEDILKSPLDNSGIHRKLMNIWDRRTIPKYTMVSYRSFFKSACREIKLVNNERKVNAQRNNITTDEYVELHDYFVQRVRWSDAHQVAKVALCVGVPDARI